MLLRRWRRLLVRGGIVPALCLAGVVFFLIWLWIATFRMWLQVPWYPGQSVGGVYWRAFLFATKAAALGLIAAAFAGLAVLAAAGRR